MPQLRFNITSVGTYQVPVIVGAVVGGCSAINAMAFQRGQRDDYERWEELGGGEGGEVGWGWKGMWEYFLKASRFKEPDPGLAKQFGIRYDRRHWGSENGTEILYEAWKDIPGIEYPDDNGQGESGPQWFPSSVDPATITRSYSNTAHYQPYKSRLNYHLITEHKVSKINFVTADGKEPKAESVTFVSRETAERRTVFARKEVILAAGAVHSPQILQRSGVGPRKLLEEAGIELVKELPGVGNNFQDHTSLNLGYNFTTQPFPNLDALATNATYQAEVDEMWNKTRVGPYSAWGNTASHALVSFPVISPDTYQDLANQIENQDPAAYFPPGTHPTVIVGYKVHLRVLAKGMRSKNTGWIQIANAPSGNAALTNSHPLSRGTIMLNTSDPEGEPVVDYRAMSNPLDIKIFVEMIRLMRRYVLADAIIKQLSPVWYNPPLEMTTDEEIGDWTKRTDVLLPTVYHPIGTCSKMPREWGGVVSEDLRVHGVEWLSVVDASIIPSLVGATTGQSVYAVAEKVRFISTLEV
ncbi:hypothetical protein HYALB_00013877 [Hymenoscyphus albidus]|uniref:Glucose-methanol-choline oxidoreductase N-terminal domain-containing protein n=1 Tax=Hymenoscyphus albidus TaxID=595503 RepID=A0A9N9LX98_9HELO|nr:hypothetical protein HYALB_00013877 [Hymenoscyphus albidus]